MFNVKAFRIITIGIVSGLIFSCSGNDVTSVNSNKPTITSLKPLEGPTKTEVTIKGDHFNKKTEVSFASYEAKKKSVHENKMVVEVPTGLTTPVVGPKLGKVKVTISNGDKSTEHSKKFYVTKTKFSTTAFQEGTVYIEPDMIKSSDESFFKSLSYEKRKNQLIYDARIPGNVYRNVYLLKVTFKNSETASIYVNPEFKDSNAALKVSKKYAIALSKLPYDLRKGIHSLTVNKGDEGAQGENHNAILYTGSYRNDDTIQETLLHESGHATLESTNLDFKAYKEAQRLDPTFISPYAREHPDREDLAESLAPWFALRYQRDRLSNTMIYTIKQAIPNRLAWFDSLNLDMTPYQLN